MQPLLYGNFSFEFRRRDSWSNFFLLNIINPKRSRRAEKCVSDITISNFNPHTPVAQKIADQR